ncbi:kinase-like protein [Terfezia boudieri ATCC MYA-4762]|uniref:non-specific serine/threonine protein kinase n=1 Tax=Terfezia boudieri ATCC MYA-4762 TaxID=1051890 RepID=A0A3N4LX92_9PEZI|nr:kinase-like protein [Terfezia boudieri ATCC MYA-4762]
MDPPATPRRLGARNLNQKQKEPAHVSSPKPPTVDIFSQSLPPPRSLHGRTKSGEPTDDTSRALGTSPKKIQSPQLVDMFDSTLRLAPTSPPAKPQPTPTKKLVNTPNEDNQPTEISMLRMDEKGGLRRRNNKENARPILTRESTTPALPAISENGTAPTMRKKYDPLRNLTVEEREKLAKPQVKRLANVAQLYFLDYYFDLLTYVHNRKQRLARFREENDPVDNPEDYKVNWKQYTGRERANLRKRRTRLRQHDFQILTQVGQGGYGQVYLAQKKDTKEICALKVMSKKLLFKLDEIRHVLTERDILTAAKSPWLVKLLYAFQDDENIYLSMEYVAGGDFRTLLNNTGVLHNRHARFYVAEMFAAVDALHRLGYIHRDLKPENFLVDATGHIKLTDFGLSAGMLSPTRLESMRLKLDQVKDMKIVERTTLERRAAYKTMRESDINYANSIVGSPDYMAPEVLKGEEYDFTVDYWSLGCMLYEALAGYPPFAGGTTEETWHNLKHWRKVLQKPEFEDPNYFLSVRTWDIITRLIASKQARFHSIEEVQQHRYFADTDWERLREAKAPFVPDLDSETDAGYFDDFSNEQDMAKYKEVHDKQMALDSLADRNDKLNKGLFVGFTFRHRKEAPITSAGFLSPRTEKQVQVDDEYGTIF